MVEIKDARTKPRPASPPKVTAIRQPKAEPEPQPFNREQAIGGVFQLVAAPLAIVAPADAAAIVIHAQPIGEAAAEVAANDPRFAALIDKIIHVGPYGALLAEIFPLVLQLLANHNLVPVGIMGTVSKDELLDAMIPDEIREALAAQAKATQTEAGSHDAYRNPANPNGSQVAHDSGHPAT